MTTVLEVDGLEMHFGMVTAAQGLNVTVVGGELVGIIGPNGAGKTTFINLLTGYLRPEAGRIHLLGLDVVGRHPHEVARLGVGRSFQIPQLFLTLTVLDNVLLALATAAGRSLDPWHPLHRLDRVDTARGVLDQFGLADHAHRPAAELAEGARKLLDVAMAFAPGPRLLLLDEPTSGVSVEEKYEVMETLTAVLRRSRVTTLFVEHDMDVVRRYADRVLVLSDGRFIADGGPTDILGDPDIQRAVAGRV
ncbi:MAG: ABC transporter ATP-binding protein [Acidimicrobiales bacterium]